MTALKPKYHVGQMVSFCPYYAAPTRKLTAPVVAIHGPRNDAGCFLYKLDTGNSKVFNLYWENELQDATGGIEVKK